MGLDIRYSGRQNLPDSVEVKPEPTASAASSRLSPASHSTQSETHHRYAIRCLACEDRWTEEVPAGERAGDFHRCFAYQGTEDWRWHSTIRSRRIRHDGLRPAHPCGRACRLSLGHLCHCECGGKEHGRFRLRARSSRASLIAIESLYNRLEVPIARPMEERDEHES
jgi:hypothetical protein